MELIKNKKINEIYKKRKLSSLDKYNDENKEYAFLANLILDNGSETNEINENNLIKESYSDIIWTDKTIEENNYSFIKFLKREQIIENNFLSNKIHDLKNKIKQNDKQISELLDSVNDEFDNDDKGINKFIFVNLSEKESKNKEEIIKDIKNDFDWNQNDVIQILELKDLIKMYESKFSSKLSVDKAILNISTGKNNFLKFENNSSNNGIVDRAYIFNLSAKSIKELYETYGNQVLNLNLRYFKKKKGVDDDIKKSISNPEHFWYLNNGLVIVCDDLKIEENKITLLNFSIVNGGQTTYNIANQDFDDDFFVISKIICIKNWSSKENNEKAYELANQIAIASNKQKPIDNKDLISNNPLATSIKNTFAQNNDKLNFKIYIETKTKSFDYDENAKLIYNKRNDVFSLENLLQLNWTWEKIMPGTAKNAKSRIYKDIDKMNRSLKEIKDNYKLYSELCYLFRTFDLFKKIKSLDERIKNNQWGQNVIKNCLMYNIVVIRFIFAYFKLKEEGEDIFNYLKNYESMVEFIESKKIIINRIFKQDFVDLSLEKRKQKLLNVLISLEPNSPFPDALSAATHQLGNDASNIHNIVKKDSNIYIYVFEFLRLLKNNTDYQKLLKDIFDINGENNV